MGRRFESDYEDAGEAKVIKNTGNALLVELEGDEKWIPLSVINSTETEFFNDTSSVAYSPSDAEPGMIASELHVAKWFAEKEGLV